MQRISNGAWMLVVLFVMFTVLVVRAAAIQVDVMPAQIIPDGNPVQGFQAVQTYGCGACHVIDGVTGADGQAGPRLSGLANRMYIAGALVNTPENLAHFIQHPQETNPRQGMPDVGVTDTDARDIAAYLYTLR